MRPRHTIGRESLKCEDYSDVKLRKMKDNSKSRMLSAESLTEVILKLNTKIPKR
jgi:hypothetical protein